MPESLLQAAAIVLSPATLYWAPVGTALVAKTVPYGTPWGGAWQRVGLTSAPLRFAYNFTVVAAKVQETMGDVQRKKVTEEALLETTMAELNLELMPLGLGGVTTLTPQSAGVPASESWSIGGDNDLAKRMWGFEGKWNKDDGIIFPIRFFVWKATGTAGGDLTFNREEYVPGIPLRLSALADTTRAVGDQLVTGYRVTSVAGV